MLPQEAARLGVHDPDVEAVPLHADLAPDPAWRRAVVGRFDLDGFVSETIGLGDVEAAFAGARFQFSINLTTDTMARAAAPGAPPARSRRALRLAERRRGE